MTRTSTLRHNLPVALFLTATLLIVPASQAAASIQHSRMPHAVVVAERRRHSQIPSRVCPIRWWRGPAFVRRLVICAANRYQVPGGASEALYIADRESHFDARAYNAWSGAMGVFQHLSSYWPGRASAYGFPGWSGFNARANIFVTMRMVKTGGWGPWSL
jgi:hypothetical protein